MLRMAARMSKPAFLNLFRLSDRYLDEAQSKRRAAIKILIGSGQCSAASLI